MKIFRRNLGKQSKLAVVLADIETIKDGHKRLGKLPPLHYEVQPQ